MIVALIGMCTSAAAVVGRFPKWKTVMRIFENHCVVSLNYRRVSNIRRMLVGNKIVDHSEVVGASPVSAAPTTSSFST